LRKIAALFAPLFPIFSHDPMNDKAIRSALIARVAAADHDTVIFEELPLCRGIGRADVAAVNGALWGYEIKGKGDSVRRLSKQVDDYQHIFDYCVVAVAPNHLAAARRIVPAHWGIIVACEADGVIVLRQVRKARRNRAVNTEALIRLMWKQEALTALKNHGILLNHRSFVCTIWDTIAAQLRPAEIATEVRIALKARGGFGSSEH
jgi:hypothetical protein